MQTTRLGRSWLFKNTVFMLVLLGFGAWGLYDAAYLYPKRGAADASYKLKNYLEAARNASQLTPAAVKVEDPAKAYAELAAQEKELRRDAEAATSTQRDSLMKYQKLQWLRALKVSWKLSDKPVEVARGKGQTGSAATGAGQDAGGAAGTSPPSTGGTRVLYFEPTLGTGYALEGPDRSKVDVSLGALLDELSRKWNQQNQTQPLSSYDLAVQWIFVAVGFGGGLYLLVMILRAAGTKYRWEPEAQRLTLPGGRAIVPADLKDVDKRRWHKFYVTLDLKDGTHVPLDLYRYDPLEQWVLDMERAAFPDRAREAEMQAESLPPSETAPEKPVV